jgi:hypothetical protein
VIGQPDPATCPSSSCSPGNLLLGIVRPNGTVAALRPPIQVDATFVAKASNNDHRPPESRFRFAGPCVMSACRHWSSDRCGLGDAVAGAARTVGEDFVPPPCAIRSSCRWWRQNGSSACQVCPLIVHTPAVTTARRSVEGTSPGLS